MKSTLMKRLEVVETSLSARMAECALLSWPDDSHDDIDEKIDHWRNGEDIPGAPTTSWIARTRM